LTITRCSSLSNTTSTTSSGVRRIRNRPKRAELFLATAW
jgi:hypothetical protein